MIKKLIPTFIKDRIKSKLVAWAEGNLSRSNQDYHCPVCNARVAGFKPIGWKFLQELNRTGFVHSITDFETFNFTSYYCPLCSSNDRERLSVLFVKQYLQSTNVKAIVKFLDFAPSQAVTRLFRNDSRIEYVTIDLERSDVDIRADICNLHMIPDDSINIFICSHVLEHVESDSKAVQELFRILSRDGIGIIMVPVLLSIDSNYANQNAITENERCKYHMQGDHVRIYSKSGFTSLIKKAGFIISELDVNYFGRDQFSLYGIQERSILYVVKKG